MTYKIMGKYRSEVEEIDSCESKKEADILLQEYRMAFGMSWRVWVEVQADVDCST
jgi:hypothetical protein